MSSSSGYWRAKVAIVTGGSAGLGLALAQAIAREGGRVVVAVRDAKRLAAALPEVSADTQFVFGVPCDVTRDTDVSALIDQTLERFGRLDMFVNNAGRSMRGLALETSLADYRDLWELNFLAAVRCSQQAVPHLRKHQGHLVNIGSLASKSASPFLGGYAASKFPLAAFSQQLRLELADAVHVLLVCPGPIARDDSSPRYTPAGAVPDSAQRPGGGVKLRGIPPSELARRVLSACEQRQAELIVPGKARLLFALSQLFPRWADKLVLRMTRG